jgi:hypothetical protein
MLIREKIKTIYDRGSEAVVARVERLRAFIAHHQQEIIPLVTTAK